MRYFRLIVYIVLALVVASCQTSNILNSRITPVKNMVKGVFSGDVTEVLTPLCIGSGITPAISIRAGWQDDSYEVIYADGDYAQIEVTGRVIVTSRELEGYIEKLNAIDELSEEVDIPDISSLSAGVAIGIKYDGFEVIKEVGGWCVTEDSLYGFYVYIVELFVEEIGELN